MKHDPDERHHDGQEDEGGDKEGEAAIDQTLLPMDPINMMPLKWRVEKLPIMQ